MVAVKDSLTFKLHDLHQDQHDRYMLVCDFAGSTYTFVNLYAPNVHPLWFLFKLLKCVKKCKKDEFCSVEILTI